MTRVRATLAAALGMTALVAVAPGARAGAGGAPEGAPRCAPARAVPDALFGGTSLGRIGDKDRHCYATEVAQLRRHATVHDGARWRIGFMDGHTVSAQVRTVTLHRGGDLRAAARSQGCYDT